MKRTAVLALADGTWFAGEGFGAPGEAQGEVCFNTAMTGYQEILTDPSYNGQIVTMTYPEIGNYGVNPDDVESGRVQVAGFVVKRCCPEPSSWRHAGGAGAGLSDYLAQVGIPGIQGIDTRMLVRRLRERGAQPGILVHGEYRLEEVLSRAALVPAMNGRNLAMAAGVREPYGWSQELHPLRFSPLEPGARGIRLTVLDYGLKYNILRLLRTSGAEVRVFPPGSTAAEILQSGCHGVVLSNGPGDPEPVKEAVETIRQLLGKLPVFGICLGHQLLCLALGARTFKLKFGHRGANHPVRHLPTGSVAVTSQNHGFAVDPESLDPAQVEVTHVNLNDGTVAGIRHRKWPVFSVQYHPEASPGPHDSEHLFHRFLESALAHKSGPATPI